MKAIFIPSSFVPNIDLLKLNQELKDSYSIEKEISTDSGMVLIVNNTTRKEKLDNLDKISKE